MIKLLETATELLPAQETLDNVSAFTQWLQSLPEQLFNLLPKIVAAIVILIVGWFIGKLAGKILKQVMVKRRVDETVHYFLCRMLVITLRIVFVLFALSAVGVNINSFIAALGAAGITAGLGLQSSIAQFASGVEILFNKPFRKGDFIEIDGVTGTVEEIHFMNTTLITLDNKRVITPNSHVTTNCIINYTAQHKRRIDLKYSIAYGDDIALAKQVLAQAVEACPYTLADPKTIIAVSEHSDSAIVLDTFVWCRSEDYWTTFYDMQERVKLAFDKAGLHIPFNQMDVHIIQEQTEKE